MSRSALRFSLMAAVVALLALIPATRPSAAAAPASVVGPKAYYLALGDSLAYGLQPDFNNNKGYPADFFTDLQTHGTQTLADMGCSGETTTTFIQGGCPYIAFLPPHYPFTGPQLGAALAFLRQHAGQVSPVTIDVGANDILNIIDASTCTISNITPTIQTVAANFATILSQLKTALGGSGDLIAMTYYFPYQNMCPTLTPVIEYLDSLFKTAAQRYGALVAPVFTTFGGATTPNPNLCTFTWICETQTYFTCKLDASFCVHPTTLGYKVIAGTFEATAGY